MSRDRIQTSFTVAELGQVLTQGWMLYRNHWWAYNLLAFQALAMLLYPLWGWPRYCAYKAAILSHAIASLDSKGNNENRPPSIQDCLRKTNRQRSRLLAVSLHSAFEWFHWWSINSLKILCGLLLIISLLIGLSGHFDLQIAMEFRPLGLVLFVFFLFGISLLAISFLFAPNTLNSQAIALTKPHFCVVQVYRESQLQNRSTQGRLLILSLCMWFISILLTYPMILCFNFLNEQILSNSPLLLRELKIAILELLFLASLINKPGLILLFTALIILLVQKAEILLPSAILISCLGLSSMVMMAYWQSVKATLQYRWRDLNQYANL